MKFRFFNCFFNGGLGYGIVLNQLDCFENITYPIPSNSQVGFLVTLCKPTKIVLVENGKLAVHEVIRLEFVIDHRYSDGSKGSSSSMKVQIIQVVEYLHNPDLLLDIIKKNSQSK